MQPFCVSLGCVLEDSLRPTLRLFRLASKREGVKSVGAFIQAAASVFLTAHGTVEDCAAYSHVREAGDPRLISSYHCLKIAFMQSASR
jgi:hypothetical protein